MNIQYDAEFEDFLDKDDEYQTLIVEYNKIDAQRELVQDMLDDSNSLMDCAFVTLSEYDRYHDEHPDGFMSEFKEYEHSVCHFQVFLAKLIKQLDKEIRVAEEALLAREKHLEYLYQRGE